MAMSPVQENIISGTEQKSRRLQGFGTGLYTDPNQNAGNAGAKAGSPVSEEQQFEEADIPF